MRLKTYFLILFFASNVFGQSGINTRTPNSNTLLHVSEKNDEGEISNKGLLIPRLTDAQRDELTYLDPTAAVKVLKLTADDDGLMIFNTSDNCFNFWKFSELEWKSVCGSLGNAEFTIDCSNIKVNGVYENEKELTSNNNLSFSVSVTKPGGYNIVGLTENDNGYSFQATGTFLTTGTYTINVLGSGTPLEPSVDGTPGDKIIIENNGTVICNDTYIFVNNSAILPEFSINCQSISVNGNYTVNSNLIASNTITLNINSNASAAGAPFQINTSPVNGYSFSGQGILNGGQQQVTLVGNGKPITNGEDSFTLMTNSTLGASSCTVKVKIAARKMKILGIANNDNSYNIGRSSNLLHQVLNNNNYFANNQSATFPVNGFEYLEMGGGNLSNSNKTSITNFNPDIVLIQYNYYASQETDRIFLKELLDKGVVVIYCTDGDGATSSRNVAAKDFIDLALGVTDITVTGTVNSDLMQIIDTGTMITSGPFMNLAGNSMGRDAGNNFGVNISTFPYDKASIIAYQDASMSSIRGFVSKINGFVFFGDGAPFAANTGTEAYNWPAKFRTTNGVTVAIPNTYGTVTSYNSFLFLNLMSWAITYAQNNKN